MKVVNFHSLFFVPLYSQIFDKLFDGKKSNGEKMIDFSRDVLAQLSLSSHSFEWIKDILINKLLKKVAQKPLRLSKVQKVMKEVFSAMRGYTIKVSPNDLRAKWVREEEMDKSSASYIFDIDFIYDIVLPFLYANLDQMIWDDKDEAAQMLMLTEIWTKQGGSYPYYFKPVAPRELRKYIEKHWNQVYTEYIEQLIDDNAKKIIQDAYMQYVQGVDASAVSAVAAPILENSSRVRSIGRIVLAVWFVPVKTFQRDDMFSGIPRDVRSMVQFFHDLPSSLTTEDAYGLPPLPKIQLTGDAFLQFVHESVTGRDVQAEWARLFKKAEQGTKNGIVSDAIKDLYRTSGQEKGKVDVDTLYDKYAQLKKIVRDDDEGALQNFLSYAARVVIPAVIIPFEKADIQEVLSDANTNVNKKIRREQVASVHTLFFTPLYIEVFDRMFPREKSQKDAMVALMRHVIDQLSQSEQASFAWMHDILTDPIIMHIDDDEPITLTSVQKNIKTLLQKLAERTIKISPLDLVVNLRPRESSPQSLDALFQIDFLYDLLFPFMYARLYQSRDTEKYTNEQYFEIVEQWIKKSTDEMTLPIHPREIEDYIKAVWKDIYEREKARQIGGDTREKIQQAFDAYMKGTENVDISAETWNASYSLRNIGRTLFGSWFVPMEMLKDEPFFSEIPKDAQRLVAFFHHLPESLRHFSQYDLPTLPAQRVSRNEFTEHISAFTTLGAVDDKAVAFEQDMADILRVSQDDTQIRLLLKEMKSLLFEDNRSNADLYRLSQVRDVFDKLDDTATRLPSENASRSMIEKMLDNIAQIAVPSIFVLEKDKEKENKSQEDIAYLHTLFFVPLYVQVFERLFPRKQSHIESMRKLVQRITKEERSLAGVWNILEPIVMHIDDDTPLYLEKVQKSVSNLFDILNGDVIKISPLDFGIKRVSPQKQEELFTRQSFFSIDFIYDVLLPFLYTRLSKIRISEWEKSRQFLFIVRDWLFQHQNQLQGRSSSYIIPVDHVDLTQYMKRALEDIYTKARSDMVDAETEQKINQLYSSYARDDTEQGITEDDKDAIKKSVQLRYIGRLVLGLWFVPMKILRDQVIFRQIPQTMRDLISFYHGFPESTRDPGSYGAASFPLRRVDENGIENYIKENVGDMDVLSEWKKNVRDLQQKIDNVGKNDASAEKDAMQQALQSLYDKTTQTSAVLPSLDELMKDYRTLNEVASQLGSEEVTRALDITLSFASQKLIPYIYILRDSTSSLQEKDTTITPGSDTGILEEDEDTVSIHTMFFIPLYTRLFDRVFPKNMSTRESMTKFTQYVIDEAPSNVPSLDWLGEIVIQNIISRVDESGPPLSLLMVQDAMRQLLQKLDGHVIRIHPEDLSIKWLSKEESQAMTAAGLFDIDYVYDILLPFLFTRLGLFTWNDAYEREHIMFLVEKWVTYKRQSNGAASFELPVRKTDFQSFMEQQWHGVYEKYKDNYIDEGAKEIVSQAYSDYTSPQKSTKSMPKKVMEWSSVVRTVGRLMLGFWFIPFEELQRQLVFQTLPQEGKILADFFHNFPTSSSVNLPKNINKTVSPTAFLTFVDGLVGKFNVMEKWNEHYLMAFRYVHRAKEKANDESKTSFYTSLQAVLNEVFVQTTSPDLPEFGKMKEKYDMLKYQVGEVSDLETKRILEGILELVTRSVIPFLYVLIPEGIRVPRKTVDVGKDMSNETQEDKLEEIKKLTEEMKKIKEDFAFVYYKVIKQSSKKNGGTGNLDETSIMTVKNIEKIKLQIEEKAKQVKKKKEEKAHIEEYILKNARFLERRYESGMRGFGRFGRLDNNDGLQEKINKSNTRLDILNQEIDEERDEIDKLREKLAKLEREGKDTISKKDLTEKEVVIERIDQSLTQNEIIVQDNYALAKEHLRDFQKTGNPIFLEKIEFLYRKSRKLVDESREMVNMWKKQENIDVDQSKKNEMEHLQEKWENELDRKERMLIKRENKIKGDKDCLTWREKVGRRFSPEFNIDAFEIINIKIDNFQRRLKPFEENTTVDLERFVNDAFQYVKGPSNTKDGHINVLAEESFKNAYKQAIGFGYRALDRYRRFHFDFIMKRIRRELDYLKFWRETPGYKESVQQYSKYFDKVDERLKNTAEMAQRFLLTDFEKTFSRNMERFDLANIVDNTERMDFLIYQRQVMAKAAQVAKTVQSDYFDRVNIIQMLVDRQFLLSFVLNAASIGLFFLALHWGEKTYKDTYKRNNYAQNPPLLLFTGSALAYYVIMQAIIIACLSGLYVYNFDTYYIDAKFIYTFATEQVFQTLVFGVIAIILTVVCQNVSLFRYDQEALRGFRALKQMLISICIVLFIVPLFYLL